MPTLAPSAPKVRLHRLTLFRRRTGTCGSRWPGRVGLEHWTAAPIGESWLQHWQSSVHLVVPVWYFTGKTGQNDSERKGKNKSGSEK